MAAVLTHQRRNRPVAIQSGGSTGGSGWQKAARERSMGGTHRRGWQS
jgi:hypothetical protein